jgi:hypothetical protein
MPSARAIVKVILATEDNREINSSIMSREEAEADAQAIDEARRKAGNVDLPWLKVSGNHVLAVYLEGRSAGRKG